MLEEGKYRGAIREWGKSKSKNDKLRFEITVRLSSIITEDGEVEEMEKPVSRSVFFYLTPPAMDMSTAAIRSLGYTRSDLDGLDPLDDNPFDFGGVEVTVEVTHEEYPLGTGTMKERVELVRGFSRKLRTKDLSGFDEIRLAFAASQEEKASNKQAAPAESQGRRRKKAPAAPVDDDTPS